TATTGCASASPRTAICAASSTSTSRGRTSASWMGWTPPSTMVTRSRSFPPWPGVRIGPMPTRIFFSNGEQVTVSDEPEAVAAALGAGVLSKLERPWGDEAIYVNPAVINYIESQDERAPDIEAMEASPGQ